MQAPLRRSLPSLRLLASRASACTHSTERFAMERRHFGRRSFLQGASAAGLGAGLGSWSALEGITPALARAMKVGPDAVVFRPEIEPIVRWIEETPRNEILDFAVAKLREGLSYRDLLSGLFLAGIRNVKPRPVGFKFHAILVINSAHLLGQTAAVKDRLLPLFWALDTFKNSQEQDKREGDWTLSKVDEARLPKPSQARAELERALEKWDAEAADAAVASLCRSAGAEEVMAPLWRAGIRDQRNIGHKAIFTAQSWRTLQAIGWQHAEPVLRSLVFGILDLQGDSNKEPAPVGPFTVNLENAKKIRGDWQVGRNDPAATQALLETMRKSSSEDACAHSLRLLNEGIAPDSLWDAVALAGSERLMRAPGILSIHAVTSANALHFIFGACGDDSTRKLALLQAVGWMPMFRQGSGAAAGLVIDDMKVEENVASGPEAIEEIFATVGSSRAKAANKTLAYLSKGGSFDLLFQSARRMVFTKGRDAHDYKYAVAAWEEHQLASDDKWRAPLAAALMFNLPAAGTPDSPLMVKAREAVEKI